MMYRQFIDLAEELYLTEIEAIDDAAETYFPEFDKENYIKEVIRGNEDNGIKYEHVVYKKIK